MKTSSVKEFFHNAFEDMKKSAKAQHEVDKANLNAVKQNQKRNLKKQKQWVTLKPEKK